MIPCCGRWWKSPTGPDIGAGIGCQHVGDANIGLLEVNFVAPVVEHHVDIPDGALAALKGFGNLELAAVAFVTQTSAEAPL